MSNRALIRSVSTFAVLLAASIVGAWFAARRGDGRPVCVIDRPSQQLSGTIPGEAREAAFLVRNAGTGVLRVSNLTTTCGCTKAAIEPPVVPPGGTSKLIVRFAPPLQPGQFAHSVEFRTNDPSSPSARVTFSGTAAWPVEVRPTSLLVNTSGATPPEQSTLELYTTSGESIDVTSVIASDTWIHVEDAGGELASHRKKFLVRLDPPTSAGVRSGTIRFVTSASRRPVLLVPVRCEVFSASAVTPRRLILNRLDGRATTLAKFLIAANGKPCRLSDITADGKGWSVARWDLSDVVGGRCLCTVELNLPKESGYTRSGLIFHAAPGEILDRVELSSLIAASPDDRPGPK